MVRRELRKTQKSVLRIAGELQTSIKRNLATFLL